MHTTRLTVCLLLLAVGVQQAFGAPTWQKIGLSDQQIAMPGGTANPWLGRMNESGTFLFPARFKPTTGAIQDVLIRGTPGNFSIVAQFGTRAPGTNNNFSKLGASIPFNDSVLGAGGHYAFYERLNSTSSTDEGLWLGNAQTLELAAREGNTYTFGVVYGPLHDFSPPALNSQGNVAFAARIGSGNDSGLWVGGAGSLALVARQGQLDPAGVPYPTLERTVPMLSDAGEVAFLTDFGTSGPASMYAGAPGQLRIVGRTGYPAVGSINYALLSQPTLNQAGAVAFRAMVTIAGDSNNGAIFTNTAAAGTSLIVKENDPVPGLAGVNFDLPNQFGAHMADPDIKMTSTGRLLFSSNLTGSGVTTANNLALFQTNGSAIDMILRTGDAAPGLPAGNVFTRIESQTMNDLGQVVIEAYASDTTNQFKYQGLWLRDQTGALSCLVADGQMFDIGGGTLRQVESVQLYQDSDEIGGAGFPPRLLNDGRLPVYLTFFNGTTGSSGLFVVQVPEPSTFVLGGLGMVCLLAAGLRKRRRLDAA